MMGHYLTSLAVGKISGEVEARNIRSSYWAGEIGCQMRKSELQKPALVFPPRPVLCPLGNMISTDM